MSTTLRIAHLVDHPETLPVLKEWFETEWESYYGPHGPGDAEKDLISYANQGELPLALVAFIGDELCGIAALKAESLSTHAHLCPWAAAGLVSPAHRRQGIGAHLLSALEEVASTLGYAHIYCGTSTAVGILHRTGWQFMERVSYNGDDVSIYQKGLSPGAAAMRGAAPC
jgi:GNAT superfamily N-acetyltransferase